MRAKALKAALDPDSAHSTLPGACISDPLCVLHRQPAGEFSARSLRLAVEPDQFESLSHFSKYDNSQLDRHGRLPRGLNVTREGVSVAIMISLLIATRNAHKVGEIRAILGNGLRYFTLEDFPAAPLVVEDAATFAGNAAKKAGELAKWFSSVQCSMFSVQSSKCFVLADDSGLEVDALNGEPGVHSARFAALDKGQPGNSPDADNNAKLLRLLANVPAEKRTARFRCVTALVSAGNLQSAICNLQLFEGTCEGRIAFRPSGQGGFGYDPLFVPKGFEQSFAELGEDLKNRLSHRARALEKLRIALAA